MSQRTCCACQHTGSPDDPVNVAIDGDNGQTEWLCDVAQKCAERVAEQKADRARRFKQVVSGEAQ